MGRVDAQQNDEERKTNKKKTQKNWSEILL